jgi:anti-sigma factor RsiW
MTTNATDPSKERMDCARVAREDVFEGYLQGKLSEEDRDAFEEHYFACARCFDELQTLQAAREELERSRPELAQRTPLVCAWGAVAVVSWYRRRDSAGRFVAGYGAVSPS